MKDRAHEQLEKFLGASDLGTFLSISVIAVLSFLLRIDDLGYVPDSLWAEDGTILINQAHELGLSSLWEPYSGYLHLYHRIIALLSTFAPLELTPYVFMAGWIIAFLLIVWVITSRGRMAGIDRIAAVFLVLAISLQPSHGEAFLNLGQSFYFLNIAFALYVCLPSPRPIKIPYLLLLILLSLSGPASEVISLVLVIRLAVLRDFNLRKWEYLTVWICSFAQAYLTLTESNPVSSVLNTRLSDWIHAISVFLYFGSQSNLVRVFAFIFWSITLVYLFNLCRNSDKAQTLPSLLATLAAAMIFFAGMVRQGKYLAILSPIDHGSRYFVLPYALAFFVALSAVRNSLKAKMAILFSIGIICGASFLTLDRADRMGGTGLYAHENLQWIAFTKFRKINTNLVIPINPPWALSPPTWYVKVGANDSEEVDGYNVKSIPLDVLEIKSENSVLSSNGSEIDIFSEHISPKIDFDLKENCAGEEFLAVELDVWRSKPGWSRLYWSGSEGFHEKKSLGRFYMDGDVRMQFAFRRDTSDSFLRLDLMKGIEKWIGQNEAAVVPLPTGPGGQAKIKKISVFCLGKL